MSDASLRELERRAKAGDREAQQRLRAGLLRLRDPRLEILEAQQGDLNIMIALADVREVWDSSWLEGGAANVLVTSPPYKKADGFDHELMQTVGEFAHRALVPGAWVFFNFGQLREDFLRPWKAFSGFLNGSLGMDDALVAHQQIAWVKSYSPGPGQPCRGHCQPLNSPNLLNYSWEHLFTAFKPTALGGEPELDRLAVGVPFADQSNLTRGTRGKNGNLRCGGDVWVVGYETTGATKKKAHDYEYPAELVERCLKVSGCAGLAARGERQVVLDTFLGAGQTAVVAKRLGISAVGVERDRKRAERALARWKEA